MKTILFHIVEELSVKWLFSPFVVSRTTTAPAHELLQTNWLSWSKSSAQFKRTVRTVQFSSWELFRQFFWTELNCSNSSVQFMRTVQTVLMNWTELFEQFSSVHEELSEQFLWTELELNCRSPSRVENRFFARDVFCYLWATLKSSEGERVRFFAPMTSFV